MEKVEKCPSCSLEQPPLTLYLEHPEWYMDLSNIPDNRVYALTCVACGHSIEKFTVDNTTTAVKELRAEMDQLYGESYIFPISILL